MFRKIREAQKNEEGFTLIELLVVVIIIGILAAIAIPAFLSQRESARRGAAESDARNAAIALETAFTVNDEYPVATSMTNDPTATGDEVFYVHADNSINNTAANARAEISVSSGVTLDYAPNAAGTGYTIAASHQDVNSGGETITYNSETGGLADAWEVTPAP